MNYDAIVEGLLFLVGDDGLSFKQIKEILEIDETIVKEIIFRLQEKYKLETSGLKLNCLENTYKLSTKPEHKHYYEKLVISEETNQLSQAALETLAIIAYNEPITRVEVDELRGVSTSHIVRKLVAKGLLKDVGKSELPGRPTLYKTTKEFLDYFGLSSVDDLPNLKEIEADEEALDLFQINKKIEELEIIED